MLRTYRNSCLAVLVGDVGKSSSLKMKVQEKARRKQKETKERIKIYAKLSSYILKT